MNREKTNSFILVDSLDEVPAACWVYQPDPQPGRRYQDDITAVLPGVRIRDIEERWKRGGRSLFVTEEVNTGDGQRRRWHLLQAGDFLFQDETTGTVVAGRIRN